MENLFKPEEHSPGRSVLVATAITLVTLPMLVLYNLSLAPQNESIAVSVTIPGGEVANALYITASGFEASSQSGFRLGTVGKSSEVFQTHLGEAVTTTTEPVTTEAVTTEAVTTEAVTTTTVPVTTTTVPVTTTTVPVTTTTVPVTTTTTAPLPEGEIITLENGQTRVIVGGEEVPDSQMWDKLAYCESTNDWSINSGNGFYGGLQFTQASWEFVYGKGRPHENSREEQIYRAQKLWLIQGWRAWPWCTERVLGWR